MSTDSAATLIRYKREGGRLDPDQLGLISRGIASGEWCDGQIAAFAMVVAWRGMSLDETRDFAFALRDSGRRLRWDELPGPALDKHSTGGVGDCVSLVVAPLLAACGGFVPMISGRGLGHTGGTLDKLESLRGYNVNPEPEKFRSVVERVGCAIVGQNDDLAPADRRLYAMRDVTATVDVPALMVASILSKKFAGGAAAIVLDVKTGAGAQLPDVEDATTLADHLMTVANLGGMQARVLLSDMNQVLGQDAGNALEVRAALDLLCNRGAPSRLLDLSLETAAELLCMGGIATNHENALQRLRLALASGAAAERFARMVAALGGPIDLLEHPGRYLETAPVQRLVRAREPGYVSAIDVRALGNTVVQLGGGRTHPGQVLDHAVGLSEVVGCGSLIEARRPLARVHARTLSDADRAEDAVLGAFRLAAEAPAARPLLRWHLPAEVAA